MGTTRETGLQRSFATPIVPRPVIIDAEVGWPSSNDPWTTAMRYRDVLRRRWPMALAIFVTIGLGVVAGMLFRDPTYRATGVLEIRPENSESVPVDALFSASHIADDYLGTQFGILKSETLAERVVDELHLVQVPEFMPDLTWWAWLHGDKTPPPPDRQATINGFRSRLTVDPQLGSRLVQVSFDAKDPELAATVVNSILDNYVRLRMEEAQQSASWLSAQIKTTKKALDTAQRQLQAYVRSQGLQVFDTGKGETENLVNDRLKQIHQELTDAQADRYSKQSAYELARQHAQADSAADLDSPVVQGLTLRLAELRRDEASLAAVFHDDYPKLRDVRNQIAELDKALKAEIGRAVGRAQREYGAAVRREQLLQNALSSQQGAAQTLEAKSAEYASLRREVTSNEQLYTTLNDKLKQVQISAALRATNVGVVDKAKRPLIPYTSPIALNIGVGLLIGLFVAVGGMFTREYFDRSVRTVQEVDGYLGVPALAAIPAVKSRWLGKSDAWHRIDRLGGEASASSLTEAFAALRAAVLLRPNTQGQQSLLITSANPGEGKTTVSVNLALSLARLQRRVLIIDGDLRRPRLHEILGIGEGMGLAQFLDGSVEKWRTLPTQSQAGLDVIRGGFHEGADQTPSELLASPRMKQLLYEARHEYDFVIVDSPPYLAYPADVRVLATMTDGALLTVRGGTTSREAITQALSRVDRVIGVVLNGSNPSDAPSYYPQYPPSRPWDADSSSRRA